MSITPNHHVCKLPQKDTSGLEKMPPNASRSTRIRRRIRKLIVVNPDNFRCIAFFRNKSTISAEQRRHIHSPYSYMIHPFSTLCQWLEVTFISVWLWKMLLDPMFGNMIADNVFSHVFNEHILLCVQLVLIISFFFVGYIDTKTREVIIESKRVRRRYLRTFFVFDVLASEVLDVVVITILKKFVTMEYNMLKLADFAHLPCLYVRLHTIIDFLDNLGKVMNMRKKIRRCCCYLIKTYIYMHFFGCLLYLIPQVVYNQQWPSNSWLMQANITSIHVVPVHRIYGECFLMTIYYFFGASSGMYEIEQTNEQMSLTAIGLFGRIYTLYLLADVLSIFGVVGLSDSNYERQLAMLKEYMICHNLPSQLRSRMIKYYECKLQKKFFKETEILNSLSDHLRAEIFLFSASTLMTKTNVFKFLPQNEVATLISFMKRETFAPGDIVIKAGQPHDYVYFISAGTVAIMGTGDVELCHLDDGDIFGLCYAILGDARYSAIVVETSDLFIISYQDLIQFLKEYPQAIVYLHGKATERYAMYERLENVAKNKVDSCLVELRTGTVIEKRRKKPLYS